MDVKLKLDERVCILKGKKLEAIALRRDKNKWELIYAKLGDKVINSEISIKARDEKKLKEEILKIILLL